MHFGISSNLREVQRGLSDAARCQIPFATAMAINSVLVEIKRNWEKRLRRALDRPTPFTLKAFGIRRANKRTLTGTVFTKDIQGEYLDWLEDGGNRRPKRRAILVPVGQRLNKYGNMPRGSVRRSLANPATFSGKPSGGNRPAGIYKRTGRRGQGGLKLMIHYTARAAYSPILRLREGALKTTIARLPNAMLREMRKALRSAR